MEPNKATQTKTDTDHSRKAQGIHVVLGVQEEPVAQRGGDGHPGRHPYLSFKWSLTPLEFIISVLILVDTIALKKKKKAKIK